MGAVYRQEQAGPSGGLRCSSRDSRKERPICSISWPTQSQSNSEVREGGVAALKGQTWHQWRDRQAQTPIQGKEAGKAEDKK